MYQEIWEEYKNKFAHFPDLRRPLVGSVIKETRIDRGIRQMDFAKKIGMNESTLKSIENDHQQATTVENLDRCGKVLGVSSEELILLGRERDPSNYFVFKKEAPPLIKGIRKRVRAPSEWNPVVRLQFKDFDIAPISPPITTKRDFVVAKLFLPPKRSLNQLRLGMHHQVTGLLSQGFNVKIGYDGEEKSLTSNQGFGFDGFYSHSITNDDDENTAVIYLVTKFPNFQNLKTARGRPSQKNDAINIALGIERLREYRSDRKGQLISVQHLADLTESLDHEQIHKLMRIKHGSSVIYWQKIEDLLSGTGVSMEEFLKWCRNESDRYFSVATAPTRVMIDYSTYHGVKLYSIMPPGIKNEYFLGEIMIEAKGSIAKKSWERKDNSMIALYIEEGALEIAVGKMRSALPLLKGESIYFDGSLGYLLRNPGEHQAKGFMAAYPAIQF